MSNQIKSSSVAIQTEQPDRPESSVLTDRIPRWWQFPRVATGFALVLGSLFVLRSNPKVSPIWHTDVWGHLAYARWIRIHGHLPETEPLMPLAKGMPFVDSPWLSQLVGLAMFDQFHFGVTGLQFLYAATITISAAAIMIAVYRATGAAWAGLVSVIVFGLVGHQHLQIMRPQLAGMVCFCLLFAALGDGRWRRAFWWTIPLLFVVWANLHGSFVIGLGLLAATCVGRAVDVAWRTRDRRIVLRDPVLWRWLLLTQLSAAAVLVNPYGLGLYLEVVTFAGNPNLQGLIEWEPLTIRMRQGQTAAAVLVVALILFRISPRRIRGREVLVFTGLGLAALWHSRMLIWWSVAVAYLVPVHAVAVARRFSKTRPTPSPRGGHWTVATIGLACVCFVITPFGYTVLHGPPRSAEGAVAQFRDSVSELTPVDAVGYLRQNPPRGQVFNTYEWGDFLLWAGPPDIQIYVNSHAHLVPEEVWNDYMRVAVAGEAWQPMFDRYGVNTVIIDQYARSPLIDDMRLAPGWSVVYEDNVAAVFVRDNPI